MCAVICGIFCQGDFFTRLLCVSSLPVSDGELDIMGTHAYHQTDNRDNCYGCSLAKPPPNSQDTITTCVPSILSFSNALRTIILWAIPENQHSTGTTSTNPDSTGPIGDSCSKASNNLLMHGVCSHTCLRSSLDTTICRGWPIAGKKEVSQAFQGKDVTVSFHAMVKIPPSSHIVSSNNHKPNHGSPLLQIGVAIPVLP